jgi:adenylyltransferase/sulfurtransferase
MDRYTKQIALPEITLAHQEFLKGTKLLMVGAGGLGAAALPWLAGAGIGHITIADGDNIDITNLHRQTIFKDADAGKNKAELAATYIRELNPEIDVKTIMKKIVSAEQCTGFDIILDGTDNFESKTLLNEISIQTKTPLVSASVEQFQGSVAIFAGFAADAPCYHCLFPELPINCVNCNEAGILGTVAGLAGLYQAHLTLCFLLGIGDVGPGTVMSMDFKSMRTQQLHLDKNPECTICKKSSYGAKRTPITPPQIPLVHPDDLKNHLIVDVRTEEEVAYDPIAGAIHIRLDLIPERYAELPKDKLLAFACAHNVRSRRAAEYLYSLGYTNVCVLDRLTV